MNISFATSAFATLELSPRSSKAAINEAVDRLAFESDRDPAELDAARARLLSARDRVEEEIAWLPEMPPSEARRATSAALAGDLDALRSIWKTTSGLAQLNIGAAIVSLKPDPTLSAEIIGSGLLWDSRATLQILQESRAIAGSPPISEELWKRALDKHLDLICAILAKPFCLSAQTAVKLTKSVLNPRPRHFESAGNIVDGVIRNYSRIVQPKLSVLAENIQQSIISVKNDPQLHTSRIALVAQVHNWAALRGPVLLHEANRGLEDEESVSLARSIRSLAIDLANEHSAFAAAKEITDALEAGFSRLPAFAEKLNEDSKTLNELLAEKSDACHLEPLANACHAALEQSKKFALSVNAGNLRQDGKGLAANLATAFKAATNANISKPSVPWLMVRNVAIELHNELDNSDAALRLVEWLLDANPPPDIQSKLDADRRTAKDVIDANSLALALKSGRLSDARTILTSISPDAIGGPIEVRNIQNGIAARIRRRNTKWIGWGITGAIAVLAIAQADRKPNSQSEPSSLVTGMSPAAGDGPLNDGSGTLAPELGASTATLSSDAGDEQMPAPSSYGVLSRPELRWCSFESARLGVVEGRVPNDAVSAFNAAVKEFNSRCYGAQYAESDKADIDSEVANSANKIRDDAEGRLAAWTSSSQSVTTPLSGSYQAPSAVDSESPTEETAPASTPPEFPQVSQPSETDESDPTPNG